MDHAGLDVGNSICGSFQAHLELCSQGLDSVSVCRGHLLQPVGHEAVEHAKVGCQAGPHAGNLILMAGLQDLLDRIIQQQAVPMLRAQLIYELATLPALQCLVSGVYSKKAGN